MTEAELLNSFKNLAEFQVLFPDTSSVTTAVYKFPPHADALIETILNNPAQFKRIFQTKAHVINLGIEFPQYRHALISHIVNTSDEFKRLIEDFQDLWGIASWFKEYVHDLIQVLVNNPEEFKRLIKPPLNLLALAKAYPEEADSLIQVILYDINEFTRMVRDERDLWQFSKLNTQYNHIFNQPTIFRAIHEVIQYQLQQKSMSKAEIEKNVNFFMQANKANQAFFPSILEAEIASYTGTHRAHTKEETTEIAYQAMGISY